MLTRIGLFRSCAPRFMTMSQRNFASLPARNAEKDYGVAIIQDKDGNFIIDKKRTKILRQQLNVTK